MLLGYLPVTKLECFTEKRRSNVTHQLFHQCMESLLEPLRLMGNEGKEMTCADGWVHKVYTILVAYVVDFPEQCLIACCLESRCPHCLVPHNECSSPAWWDPQDQNTTAELLRQQAEGLKPMAFCQSRLTSSESFLGQPTL